jgi:hypothetical protein
MGFNSGLKGLTFIDALWEPQNDLEKYIFVDQGRKAEGKKGTNKKHQILWEQVVLCCEIWRFYASDLKQTLEMGRIKASIKPKI